MRFVAILLTLLLCGAATIGQQPASSSPTGRFETVDVFIDPQGTALAAYQVDLRSGAAQIVGIEGGEVSAYQSAPFYDPAALQHSHLIIAAFSLANDLPKQKTRVARVHLFNETGGKIDYAAKLVVAGTIDGSEIPATVSISDGGSR